MVLSNSLLSTEFSIKYKYIPTKIWGACKELHNFYLEKNFFSVEIPYRHPILLLDFYQKKWKLRNSSPELKNIQFKMS